MFIIHLLHLYKCINLIISYSKINIYYIIILFILYWIGEDSFLTYKINIFTRAFKKLYTNDVIMEQKKIII